MASARLKGTASGVVVDLSGADSADEALSMLRAALTENAGFVTGSSLTIELPAMEATERDVQDVLALCSSHGVATAAITAGGRPLYSAAPPARRNMAPAREPSTELTSPEVVSGECGIVVGTVRSGHAVRHAGNVIVFGDVNAGAEIVAGQSVVVWGALRGTVQAGARGEEGAVVCALDLAPTQLRIGQHIARAPDGPAPERQAEMARVQDGAIVVEAWSARRPRRTVSRVAMLYRAITEAIRGARKGVS